MPKTIEEISRETGFSVTTVRLVINGQSNKYRISQETRKKIEDFVATHGYSINHAARSLKLRRSETIGFVAPDLANPFFSRLMAALEVRCRQHGLVLLTASTHEDPELENRTIRNMLERGVDGIVSAPCQMPTSSLLLPGKNRTPLVFIDRDYAQTDYPVVLSNNRQSGLDLASAMLSKTKDPVYFLCGHAESPSIRDRIAGFGQACENAGISDWSALVSHSADDTCAAGQELMQQLLAARPQFAAFMCSSLLVLEGALQRLKTATGLIRPDILIGTFDDHAMLDFLPNRILSVKQDETTLADLTFQRLLEQIQGGKAASMHNVVPGMLIQRNFN